MLICLLVVLAYSKTMHSKIVTAKKVVSIAKQLHAENRKIVLVGGCFDILHIGHIKFLQKAKKQGDLLFILLEPDSNITKSKGMGRPVNTEKNRAKMLASLSMVDYVIILKPNMLNTEYDDLVVGIRPTVIATTKGDLFRHHKERQAELIGAKVVDVILPIKDYSTTKLIDLFKEL